LNVALFTAFRGVSFLEVSHKIKDAFNHMGINAKILDMEKPYVPNIKIGLPFEFQTWDLMILTMTVAPNATDIFNFLASPMMSKKAFYYGVVEGRALIKDYQKTILNNRVITPSRFAKEELAKIGVRAKTIIPHGISHKEFKVNPKEVKSFKEQYLGHKILYYLGNSDPRKGLPNLIKAINIVRYKYPNFVAIIDTLEMGVPDLRKQVEKLKLSHFVEVNPVFGNLNRHEIAVKMHAADLFTLPSHSEGFGIPLLESAACKTPSICLDAPPMNELVTQKTGFLVPYQKAEYKQLHDIMVCKCHYYNPEDFAEHIRYALENEKEREEKGIKAYENSLRYSHLETYKRFIDLL